MRLLRSITALTMAAIGMMAVVARAQDSQEEGQAAKPKLSEVTISVSSYDHSTSLSQYVTPLAGIGLQSLRVKAPLTETSPFITFIARGMPDQDNYQSALVELAQSGTRLFVDRYEYGHFDFDWRPRSESIEKKASVTVDQKIAPGIGGYATYKTDKNYEHYAAPRAADVTRTQTVGLGVGGDVLGGNAKVAATERRTYTESGGQPTTLQRTYSASFGRDLSDTLSLAGLAQTSRIEQTGLPSSDINVYLLNGAWDLAPKTTLQFRLSDQELDLNTIQNAYVQRRVTTSARLLQRIPGWSLQLGYRHLETERVRADHSFVDVPATDSFDFRAAGHMGTSRVTLRGSLEDVSKDAVMQTDDPRQLYWNNRAMVQAKVEQAGDSFAAYGVYTYRYRKNDGRGVALDWHNLALGGSYVYNWALSGFAELSYDAFRASGTAETGQSLDFYFPDSWNFAAGVDWTHDPSLTASASINFFESGDVRGTQVAFSVRRWLSENDNIEVIFAPWSRDDRQLDLTGFRSTYLSARYSVRF